MSTRIPSLSDNSSMAAVTFMASVPIGLSGSSTPPAAIMGTELSPIPRANSTTASARGWL